MLARPALLNASIFRLLNGQAQQLMPIFDVCGAYVEECIRWDSPYQNAKYTVSSKQAISSFEKNFFSFLLLLL